MKIKPNISVAIAVYNKEKQILSTLESVLKQTYPPSEIIIVNDGSTDNSEKVIQTITDNRIKYIIQENQGAAAARNTAIKNCTHDYVALIDADDIWHNDFLQEIVNSINTFPKEKVYSTGINIENKFKKPKKAQYSIPNKQEIGKHNYFKGSQISSLIYSSCVVIHKEVFNSVGYFDPLIKSGQDTDLWIRIGLEFPIVFNPKYVTTYRYIPQSLSYSGVPTNQKLRFEKFSETEKTNLDLKKYLDLNRYSLAVIAKENGDVKNYCLLKENIDKQNLNIKQRIILSAPIGAIKLMKFIKDFLERLGWQTTSF